MKKKIDFYCSLLFSLLFCLLVLDCILMAAGRMHAVPVSHKQIFLTGFLLWFLSLVGQRNSDDDWAGQV